MSGQGARSPAGCFLGATATARACRGKGSVGLPGQGAQAHGSLLGCLYPPQGFVHLAPVPDSFCNAGQGNWHRMSPQCCPLHTCPLCHPWGWAGVGDRAPPSPLPPPAVRCKHESPLQEKDPNQLSHIPGEVLGITHRQAPACPPPSAPYHSSRVGRNCPSTAPLLGRRQHRRWLAHGKGWDFKGSSPHFQVGNSQALALLCSLPTCWGSALSREPPGG